jgi:phenylpropionate dioxygenase-like ring-hydroxylating dioxygenase large terminal subunit
MSSSNHSAIIALTKKLLGRMSEPVAPGTGRVAEVAADEYTASARFDAERARIFERVPVIVAHESELRARGACLATEIAGVPIFLVRGEDGELRAFKNACRHRATRLVAEDAPCTKKAFVCPYHGWTYDLRGRLLHAPHASSFCGREASRNALVPVHAAARHGFVWASLAPFDTEAHLGGLDGDLGVIGIEKLAIYRRTTREVRGNWKLILDAFLDAYHIKHLHRDSVYRFFVDARSEFERVGEHFRAVSMRRALLEATDVPLETAPLRDLVTPSYVVFPNAVFVLHPDSFSVMTATPLAPDRTRFVHTFLVEDEPRSEAAEAHFARSFELLDGGVFAREDLAIVEAMQRGIASGGNETLLFGELEEGAIGFHEAVAARLGI